MAAEPIRTPLGGAFILGPSALPALGQEGELPRRLERGEAHHPGPTRRKERMRREMWSKIELG